MTCEHGHDRDVCVVCAQHVCDTDIYELAMPFITVLSRGGPHDDHAYTAGFEMGRLYGLMEAGQPLPDCTVQTVNVPQLDLCAMKHGYLLTAEPAVEHPEWSLCQFTQQATG